MIFLNYSFYFLLLLQQFQFMSFYHGFKPRYKVSEKSIYQHKIMKSNSRFHSIPTQSSFQSPQNYQREIGSPVLQRYSQTLEHEVLECQQKRNIRKEIKKRKAIEKFIEQRRSNASLLEELHSLKTELKNESLQNEYQMVKKERVIKMKMQENEQQKASAMAQLPYMAQMPMFQSNYLPPMQVHPQYYSPMPYVKNYENPRKYSLRQNYHFKGSANETKMNGKSFFSQSKSMLIEKAQNKSMERPMSKSLAKKLPNIKNSKKMKDFERYNNHETYSNKLRRCFMAVYFVKCLEKHHSKIIAERRKNFHKFWPTQFAKFQQDFKDYFYQRFSTFFKLLHQKSYYPLEPMEGDIPQLRDQKRKTVRKLVEVFFSCFRDFKNIKVLGKVGWAMCSHMSFVDGGVLTVSQLEIVSFEPRERYLRMDKWLQKSQIISVIFIRTLLHETLLCPWKQWPKYFDPQNETLVHNMRLLGSILYRLFITVQDEYLDSTDENKYELGNFQQLQEIKKGVKIVCKEQLLFETDKNDREMIGGLYGVEELKARGFGMKKMAGDLEEIKETVEQIYKMNRNYNLEFIKKLNLHIQTANYSY